jgi:hypothetical protein
MDVPIQDMNLLEVLGLKMSDERLAEDPRGRTAKIAKVSVRFGGHELR